MVLGGVLGALGVGLGAFGAHLVEDHVSSDDYDTYKTAAQYHLVHALALFAAAFAAERGKPSAALVAGRLFVAG
ncbi:MAG TPA: DUF423 domain-containing protein, partial [Dehalococcoidia bacterium]|nr:DUF423 domain-containing protein [Dehalococcoidia bacterium]